MQEWKDESAFPAAIARWAVYKLPFGKIHNGEPNVKGAIRNWSPFAPVLVSSPRSCHFAPPICVPELEDFAYQRALRQHRVLIALTTVFTLAVLIASIQTGAASFWRATAAGALMMAYVGFQHLAYFRNHERLRELARYVAWLYTGRAWLVIAILSMMGASAAFQVYLQRAAGGFEPMMIKYGLVFDLARDQPWRFVIGPFFHSGIAHWIGNFMFALIAAGLAAPVASTGRLLIAFFFWVVTPSILLALLPNYFRSDGFVGLSGGIFAIYGWVTGASLRFRDWFPKYHAAHVLIFAGMAIGTSSMFHVKSSGFVHSVGLLIGIVAGVAGIAARREHAGMDGGGRQCDARIIKPD